MCVAGYLPPPIRPTQLAQRLLQQQKYERVADDGITIIYHDIWCLRSILSFSFLVSPSFLSRPLLFPPLPSPPPPSFLYSPPPPPPLILPLFTPPFVILTYLPLPPSLPLSSGGEVEEIEMEVDEATDQPEEKQVFTSSLYIQLYT